MAAKEKALTNKILVELPANVKLFRNNVGLCYQGKKIRDRMTPNGREIVLLGVRVIHSGLIKGSGDLIGYTSIEVTPDMVGKKVTVFTSVEVKTPSMRITPEQKQFAKVVHEDGGFSGFAKSVEDAINITQINEENGEQNQRPQIKKPASGNSGGARNKTRKIGK